MIVHCWKYEKRHSIAVTNVSKNSIYLHKARRRQKKKTKTSGKWQARADRYRVMCVSFSHYDATQDTIWICKPVTFCRSDRLSRKRLLETSRLIMSWETDKFCKKNTKSMCLLSFAGISARDIECMSSVSVCMCAYICPQPVLRNQFVDF